MPLSKEELEASNCRVQTYRYKNEEIATIRMISGMLGIGVNEAAVLGVQLLKRTPLEELRAMMRPEVDNRGKNRLMPVRDYDENGNVLYPESNGNGAH